MTTTPHHLMMAFNLTLCDDIVVKTDGLNVGLNPSIKIIPSLITAICRDTNKDSKTDALTPADAGGYGLQVDIQ